MLGRILMLFASLAAPPRRRIVTSRGVIASRRRVGSLHLSMRRIVARLLISAHLPRWRSVVRWRIDSAPLRLMWLFASLAAPPLRRIVTSRSVIGSPFTARRRFIARRIIAFIAAFGHTFRRGAIYVFR